MKYLETGEEPQSSDVKSFLNRYPTRIFMEHGILWFRSERKDNHGRSLVLLVVPQALRKDILKAAHDHQLAGHGGTFKTTERILQSYFWPGVHQDITNYVLKCPQCQKADKKPQLTRAPLKKFEQEVVPNQRVHADLFGPLHSSEGYKYILVVTDAFTKYVELIPLRSKEAEEVATAIFNRWIV